MKKLLLLILIQAISSFAKAGCGPAYISINKIMPLDSGDSVLITLSLGGTTCPDFTSCQWYRNDTLIAGTTQVAVSNATYMAKKEGIYKVEFTGGGNGGSVHFLNVTVTFNTPTAITFIDLSKNSAILYPNPNNGNMKLDYVIPENEMGLFEMYGLMGRKVFSAELEGGKNTFNIKDSELKPAIYYYLVILNQTLVSKNKFIITD